MVKGGWWAAYRKMEDSIVWTNSNLLKMWMLCLNHAAFTEPTTQRFNGKKIKVHRGQFVTSRAAITRIYNAGCKPAQRLTEFSAWRIILKLEQFEMLHIQKGHENSVITVLNWDTYQESAQQTAQESPNNRPRTDDLLNKGNKGNKNTTTTTTTENPFDFFQQNGFGQINGFIGQDMNQWIGDFQQAGASEQEASAIIVRSLQIAVERGKTNWGYAKAILKSWDQHNLHTVAAIDAEQAKRQQARASSKPTPAFTQEREYTNDDLPF